VVNSGEGPRRGALEPGEYPKECESEYMGEYPTKRVLEYPRKERS